MKNNKLKIYPYAWTRGGEAIEESHIEAIDLNQARRLFAKEIWDMLKQDAFGTDYEWWNDDAIEDQLKEGLDTTWYRGQGWYEIYGHRVQVFSDATLGKGFDRFEIKGNELKLGRE
jgi:hypothetical protein